MTEEQAINVLNMIETHNILSEQAKQKSIDSLNKIKALKELLDKPVANIYFRQKVEDILKED